MNVVFKPSKLNEDEKDSKSWFFKSKRRFILIAGVLSVVLASGIFISLYFLNSVLISTFDSRELDSSSYQNIPELNSSPSVIELVAESYGVPAECMERLANFLSTDKSRFNGVGLFSIRQEDLGWIQDKVLLETSLNLEDDMQNAQVAAYLLKRFHDSGYSWRESFLIYTFGFSAIHDSKYQGFVNYIFSE